MNTDPAHDEQPIHPEVATAIERWRAATEQLVAAANAIDESSLRVAVHDGGWTKRDLLAHLATGYVVRIARIERILAGDEPDVSIDVERANAENVARLARASRAEIVAEMLRVRAHVESLLARLSDNHLDTRIRLDSGQTVPLRETLRDLSAHDLEHLAELGSPE